MILPLYYGHAIYGYTTTSRGELLWPDRFGPGHVIIECAQV